MLSSTFLQPCAHDKNMQQESQHEGHVLLVSYVSVIYFVYQHWTSLTLRCAALRWWESSLRNGQNPGCIFQPSAIQFYFQALVAIKPAVLRRGEEYFD